MELIGFFQNFFVKIWDVFFANVIDNLIAIFIFELIPFKLLLYFIISIFDFVRHA